MDFYSFIPVPNLKETMEFGLELNSEIAFILALTNQVLI